jgi:hypothetical protein
MSFKNALYALNQTIFTIQAAVSFLACVITCVSNIVIGHAICGSCWVTYCTQWYEENSITALSITNPNCPVCQKEMEPQLIPATKPTAPIEVETNIFDFAIQ